MPPTPPAPPPKISVSFTEHAAGVLVFSYSALPMPGMGT
jgi:hypothetical protein